MHDIGKIGIPDKILNKSGILTSQEYQCMKMHPTIGYDILSSSNYLQNVSKIVLQHHERWDGDGYPNRIKKESICKGARIIAICDSIDAMLSNRPYRKALSIEETIEEIVRNKETMYDPEIVDFLVKNVEIIENLYNSTMID